MTTLRGVVGGKYKRLADEILTMQMDANGEKKFYLNPRAIMQFLVQNIGARGATGKLTSALVETDRYPMNGKMPEMPQKLNDANPDHVKAFSNEIIELIQTTNGEETLHTVHAMAKEIMDNRMRLRGATFWPCHHLLQEFLIAYKNWEEKTDDKKPVESTSVSYTHLTLPTTPYV